MSVETIREKDAAAIILVRYSSVKVSHGLININQSMNINRSR